MKQKVAVIYGGVSNEHEVSLSSASAIIKELDKKKYQIYPILITKTNEWQLLTSSKNPVEINPYSWLKENCINICFPVLHGINGEDGNIQGLFEMLQIPYVGCNVIASALCMNKVVQKQLCGSVNIPQVKYLWFSLYEWKSNPNSITSQINIQLQFPLFIKPARSGSSIGVSKVYNTNEIKTAMDTSLNFDSSIIIEEAVDQVREIECAVMGSDSPQASVLGEIITAHEFYDYQAKYHANVSKIVIPAKITPTLLKKISTLALKTYHLLQCDGLARVDFFLGKNHQIYLNELNTMPGFTPTSMYPKLWQKSGLSFTALLDKLITLGLKRHKNSHTLF